MGRLSCQSMALKVEGGSPAQWGLNPGPLQFLHLCASCLENSSSPLAPWGEGLVLLPKPLTSQSGLKEKGWASLSMLEVLACRAERWKSGIVGWWLIQVLTRYLT